MCLPQSLFPWTNRRTELISSVLQTTDSPQAGPEQPPGACLSTLTAVRIPYTPSHVFIFHFLTLQHSFQPLWGWEGEEGT